MYPRRKRNHFRAAIVRFLHRKPKPAWFVALMHLVLLGALLLIYALPHHVIPRDRAALGVISSRNAFPTATESAAPAATPEASIAPAIPATPTPEPAPTPEPTPVGDFSVKFADKFRSSGVESDADSYVSENLNIKIEEHYANGIKFYVADFYIRDISCFRTSLARGRYGTNFTENIVNLAMREGSTLTMNGDFYGLREGGVCMRNGELLGSAEVVREIGVLYWDGRLECFLPEEFDCDREVANGAYQIWNFGPAMLDASGNPRSDFGSLYEGIYGNQPRAALGYYEPGHYCFIVAEGRTDDSRGMTLDQLGQLAQTLGLKQCYNLDGGQTAQMVFGLTPVNEPAKGGRDCSDYLTIIDSVQ